MITTMVFATAMRFAPTEVSTSVKLCVLAASSISTAAEDFAAAEVATAAEVFTSAKFIAATEPSVAVATEFPVSAEAVTIMIAATPGISITPAPVVTVMPAPVVTIMPAMVSPTLIKFRMHVVEAIPGPSANEDAVCEIIRTPIAVGCASKGIIGIVSEIAHRRRIVIAVIRADLDADGNLRLRINCRYR